eukprot:CAMPEP_0181125994 /NCGR_PEP_ID=MMETSP1071-20121207/27366_1 /TAXON_ID=35127 /ORGANISM="Thalassiosira sp., Strain NH16" /LENGTH=127 /DNA_ID=CAMNT_0023211513 /DNA_START=493 /DNA_END=876 /DNA_ORIENTATION=+
MRPPEPLPPRLVLGIAPLRLDATFEEAVLLDDLVLVAHALFGFAVVKDAGGTGDVVEVSPEVLDGGEGAELFHGFLPCVGVALFVAAGVLPQDPLIFQRVEIVRFPFHCKGQTFFKYQRTQQIAPKQ